MPIDRLIDLNYGNSGNPSHTGVPMIPVETIEPYQVTVLDQTSAGPAAVGKVLVKQFAAANAGGAYWLQSATAAQVLLYREYGVVVKNAPTVVAPNAPLGMQQALVTYSGECMAFCTTGGTTAIAPGTLLTVDGNGNFTTAPGTPTPGQIHARALGSLAISQPATLVLVSVGHA